MTAFHGLNDDEREQFVDTVEKSLEIRKRFQFYLWAQGALQSFLPHQTLLCVHGDIVQSRFRHETFSSDLIDTQAQRAVADPSNGLLARLIDGWTRRHFSPQLACAPTTGAQDANRRNGTEPYDFGDVLAHGPREATGEFGSFFVFLRMARPPGRREIYLVQMLLPYLHMALYRMLSDEGTAMHDKTAAKGPLTRREVQVLQWVKNGKTNEEIALILCISPPTVKNHVQKILRKLNVSNRAQAVGKGEALRLLTPGEVR